MIAKLIRVFVGLSIISAASLMLVTSIRSEEFLESSLLAGWFFGLGIFILITASQERGK